MKTEKNPMEQQGPAVAFVSELLPATKELEAPTDLSALMAIYTGFSKASHPYIKDGIFLQPGFTPTLAQHVSKSILGGVNDVKDEHFPQMGLVAASFLRMVALSIDNKTGQDVIKIDLYFRFTVDNCPAGERTFEKIKVGLTTRLVNHLKLEPEQFEINVLHGGSPHAIEDINDASFRAMFQVVMAGCDPKCADFKNDLLKNLRNRKLNVAQQD